MGKHEIGRPQVVGRRGLRARADQAATSGEKAVPAATSRARAGRAVMARAKAGPATTSRAKAGQAATSRAKAVPAVTRRAKAVPTAMLLAAATAAAVAIAGCGSGGTQTVSVASTTPSEIATQPQKTTGTTQPSPTTTHTKTSTSTNQTGGPEATRTGAPAFTKESGGTEGVNTAAAMVRAHGYTPNETSQYQPNQTLRVLVGTRTGSSDGYGQQAFFFVDGHYLGTDTSQPSATVKLVSQSDTEATLSYPIYKAGDPLGKPSGGEKTVRFQLNNGRLVPLGQIPPAPERNGE